MGKGRHGWVLESFKFEILVLFVSWVLLDLDLLRTANLRVQGSLNHVLAPIF